MLLTSSHSPWWLQHFLHTEIVTCFFFLPCNWVLLDFEGLSFLLLSYSLLMNPLSPSLMVIIVSPSTHIQLQALLSYLCKTMIVLRSCVLLLVCVCSIQRCVVNRSYRSLALGLGSLVEYQWTKTILRQSLIHMASFVSLRDWCCACPSVRRASSSNSCNSFMVVDVFSILHGGIRLCLLVGLHSEMLSLSDVVCHDRSSNVTSILYEGRKSLALSVIILQRLWLVFWSMGMSHTVGSTCIISLAWWLSSALRFSIWSRW